MKVRNIFSRSFTGPSATSSPPNKVNVAAFTQWSARMAASSGHYGDVSGRRASDGDVAKASKKSKTPGYPGPAYRTRTTAQTAFSHSACSSHSGYGDTVELDDSNSTAADRDRELNEFRYHAQFANVVLARADGPASVSSGSLEDNPQQAAAKDDCDSSYMEEFMESFINSTAYTIDPEEDEEASDDDDSGYYSGSQAILVRAGIQEDVSTLGGESRVLGGGAGPSGPPVLELTIPFEDGDVESDDVSVASEVTYGSCETRHTLEEACEDWSVAVRASADEKSERLSAKGSKVKEDQVTSPLVSMGRQLQRSRDDLACILHAITPSSSENQNQDIQNLKKSSTILLAECDALLMQLVTLSFKKHSTMIAKLQMCQEITLRECEDLLHQLDELKVAVVRQWVDNSSASNSRSGQDCMKCVLRIQAFARSALQRKRHKEALSSVKMIQGISRGYLVRKNLPASKMTKSYSKKRVAGTGLERLSLLGMREEKKYLTLHEERMNKLRAEYFRQTQQTQSHPKNSPEYMLAKQEMEMIARCVMILYKQELLSKKQNIGKPKGGDDHT